ncbi:MAG: type II secretion system protein [Deltaproteobacteria bacterium]|nr:type II secretion system protein [Deltaproteobacteria bacterium]
MKSRGITLIEVVLAVAIVSLVVSLLFGSFFGQDRLSQAARSKVETDQSARLALEQMAADLRLAVSPSQEGTLLGITLLTFKGEPEMVGLAQGHFLSAPIRVGWGDPVVQVTYRAWPAPTEEEGPLIITRLVESALAPDRQREEVLCRRVASLEIFYLTGEGEEVEEWGGETEGAGLPRAVRIRLSLAEGSDRLAVYECLTGPLVGLTWKRSI